MKKDKKIKEYNLHCVVCTTPILVKRAHATTCSDICRLALSNMYKKMKEDTKNLTEEELELYKALQDKIEGKNKSMNTILGQTSVPEAPALAPIEPEKKEEEDQKNK